jgi:hypothetical protein
MYGADPEQRHRAIYLDKVINPPPEEISGPRRYANIWGQIIPLYVDDSSYLIPEQQQFYDGLDQFYQKKNDEIARKYGAPVVPPKTYEDEGG